MNIQAIMKQAEKLKNDMTKAQEEINNKIYSATTSFVTIKMSGDKNIKEVKLDVDQLEKEDIEMLEDMILVTVNDLIKQINKETEEKLGKYTQGMPGLF